MYYGPMFPTGDVISLQKHHYNTMCLYFDVMSAYDTLTLGHVIGAGDMPY